MRGVIHTMVEMKSTIHFNESFLSDLREIIEFRSTSLALVKLVEY